MLEPSGPGLWERIRDRLRENPMVLVYGGGAVAAVFFIVLILIIVFALSGGGDDDEAVIGSPTPTGGSPTPARSATPTRTPNGDVPPVSEVALELTFFGDLAEVHSRPVSETFDSSEASLTLADGAEIEVPAGAFSEPTEVELAIIDLLFEDYLADPLDARIYVLSTGDDVTFGQTLILDVPEPSDTVNVREFDGDDWLPFDVPFGSSTRIELGHLSERTFSVAEDASDSSLELANVSVPSSVAVDPLVDCMESVAEIVSNQPGESLYEVALSICADALSDASGDTVQTSCMRDEIVNGSDPSDAADECAGEGPTFAPTSTPEPTPTPTPAPTPAPTPTPTKALSGTLAGSTLSTDSVFEGACTQENEDADIICSYQLLLTMDYLVTELPAQVQCRIEPQIPNFSPLSADTETLSDLDGVVTLIPRATARFDSNGTRLFSLPTLVECVLQRPIGAGEFQELDSVLIDVELPAPDV